MAQLLFPGTAVPGDVLTGKSFSAGNNYQAAGSMPNNGSPSWTPGTSNQNLAAGYYSGGTVLGDPDLAAGNILSGANIFGVAGNVTARKFASGSVASGGNLNFITDNGSNMNTVSITVSGLTFTPNIIFISTPSFIPTIYESVITMGTSSNIAMSATWLRLDGTIAYVTSSGFRLPGIGAGTYSWYAWE